MSKVFIPESYRAPLSVYELQRAIEFIKSNFQTNLSNALNLRRVSAPLFVEEASGLNDNLNGYERPVSFDIPDVHAEAQVVHSLAKWKRLALRRYQFNVGKGLFTDMNAIRRDEEVDNLHSVYVDQWDWEKVITREDRDVSYLKRTVRDIVGAVEWVESLAPEGDKIPALVEKGKNAFAGPEVSGKRLGVIGLGAIGSRVANAALKLDMEVSGYDPYLSVDSAWNLSSKVEHVTDLNVLFRTCDYLTMHIHSTPETFHYLNAETFAKMKPGMRILNFARGELVDDDALLTAIESGQVARYVTDFPNAKLVGKKNVVCFPHLGATTPEAEEKCAIMAAREIVDYLRNGNIRNSVNLPNATLDRLGKSRLCLIHRNRPGMLNRFLEIIAAGNVNVEHMLNKARGEIAYTIFDTTEHLDEAAAEEMRAIPGVTRVRLLG